MNSNRCVTPQHSLNRSMQLQLHKGAVLKGAQQLQILLTAITLGTQLNTT
jgi:hypothetical protein